jgi:hypothetical protein
MKQADTSNVSEGVTIFTDAGFACIDENSVLVVQRDDGGLFVPCAEGKHYLDGQLDCGTVYVGFFVADDIAKAA